MTKRNRSTSIGGVTKRFTQIYPDKRVIGVYASEAGVTDKRFVKISSDFEAELSNPYFAGLEGLASSGNKNAHQKFNALIYGAGIVDAVGKMDAGLPSKSSYSGYLNEANVIGLGADVILAATGTQAGDMTDSDASAETLTVVSDDADDIGYIYAVGVDANGDVLSEYIEVEGVTSHVGSVVFTTIYGIVFLDIPSFLDGTLTAAAGSITITNTTSDTTLATITVGLTEMGYKAFTDTQVGGRRIKLTASALTNTPKIIIIGKNQDGELTIEKASFAGTNDILVKPTSGRWDTVYGFVSDAFATTTIAFANMQSEEFEIGLSNAFNDMTETTNTQAGAKAKIKSDSALDTTQTLYLYGDDGGVLVYEAISLNGTTAVTTTPDFDVIAGAWLSAATVGTITVYKTDASTVMISFDGSAFLSAGMHTQIGGNVAYSALGLAARDGIVKIDSTGGNDVLIVEGLDLTGAVQRELVT
ncbi:hypothetical protein LCGC14_2409940, partial [marine sediment metagenome]